jgi:hypothetical protein
MSEESLSQQLAAAQAALTAEREAHEKTRAEREAAREWGESVYRRMSKAHAREEAHAAELSVERGRTWSAWQELEMVYPLFLTECERTRRYEAERDALNIEIEGLSLDLAQEQAEHQATQRVLAKVRATRDEAVVATAMAQTALARLEGLARALERETRQRCSRCAADAEFSAQGSRSIAFFCERCRFVAESEPGDCGLGQEYCLWKQVEPSEVRRAVVDLLREVAS